MAPRGLIVGYDTRFASEDFAAAVAEVVAANGVKVVPVRLRDADADGQLGSAGQAGRRRSDDHVEPQPLALQRLQVQAGVRGQRVAGGGGAAGGAAGGDRGVGRGEADAAGGGAASRGCVELLRPAAGVSSRSSRSWSTWSRCGTPSFKVCVDAMYGSGQGYLPGLLAGGRLRGHRAARRAQPAVPGHRRAGADRAEPDRR